MAYQGPERRRHRVFITNHREYHFSGNRCVGVKDAVTRNWIPSHEAIGRQLVGCFGTSHTGGLKVYVGKPDTGDRLCFSNDVITSPVKASRRPSDDTVMAYRPLLHTA